MRELSARVSGTDPPGPQNAVSPPCRRQASDSIGWRSRSGPARILARRRRRRSPQLLGLCLGSRRYQSAAPSKPLQPPKHGPIQCGPDRRSHDAAWTCFEVARRFHGPRPTWGCPPLDQGASWIEGERRRGQGVDNPFGAVPRADAGADQRRGPEEAASGCVRASLDVVARGPTRRNTRTGRRTSPISLPVGTDRPRSEHRPFQRRRGALRRTTAAWSSAWERPFAHARSRCAGRRRRAAVRAAAGQRHHLIRRPR